MQRTQGLQGSWAQVITHPQISFKGTPAMFKILDILLIGGTGKEGAKEKTQQFIIIRQRLGLLKLHTKPGGPTVEAAR